MPCTCCQVEHYIEGSTSAEALTLGHVIFVLMQQNVLKYVH